MLHISQESQKVLKSISLDVKDFVKEMSTLHEQRNEMVDICQHQWKVFLRKGKVKETFRKDDLLLEKGTVC